MNEGGFPFGERDPYAIAARDPAVSRHSKEELTEPRFVRSDLAARLEVEDVRVRFASPSASLIDDARLTSYGREPIRSARLAWGRRISTGRFCPSSLSSEDEQVRTVRRRGKTRLSLAVYLARSAKAIEIASFDDQGG